MTTRTVRHRYCRHKASMRFGVDSLLYRAWRKHGDPEVTAEIEVSNDEIYSKEVSYIAEFGTLAPHGYNSTVGGEASPMLSPLVAAKVSAAKIGKPRGAIHSAEYKQRLREENLGKKWGKDFCEKVSAAKKGAPSALRGRKRTPEQIENAARGNRGKKRSLEGRAAMSRAQTGKKQSAETCAKRKATWAAKRAARNAGVVQLEFT